MRLRMVLKCPTRVGVFYIARSDDGRFHPVFNGESLGSYARAQQAVDDLAGGHTFSCMHDGRRVDRSQLGIPEDVTEWERV